MLHKVKSYIYLFLCVISAIVLTGCRDDTFDDFGYIGEGDANLRATVEFENLTPALDTRTAGDAVGPVSNLQMIIYKFENGQTSFYKRVVCNTLDDYELTTSNTFEPGDKETGSSQTGNGQFESTGETTDHADFTYPLLPYGRYKIYAVANVPTLTDDDCKTEEMLKSMSFKWIDSDIKANNAMFGYFTRGDSQSSKGFDAPIIVVNSRTLDIHAWIKRMVSKVTVAFDPSELKEAVTVYVKNVTIHDIPSTCYLGKENSPKEGGLIPNGEQIKYYDDGNATDYRKWKIMLQKGSGKKGSSHSNTDDALFFFENMQGDYEGQKQYLKVQIPEETGTSIDAEGDNQYGSDPTDPKENDFKDRVKYGSYIEVEAYYVSKNPEKMSSGNIKYRFMLGKNITYNYDAQRNYHYKLTLKLRGFANEADWHISYVEPTPSLYTPDQYYVSYLYGQESGFPVRVLTGDSENTSRYTLTAEIIENAWWPYDEKSLTGLPNAYIGSGNNINGFAWLRSSVESTTSTYYGKKYAGFLSLRQPEMENGKYKDIDFGHIDGETHEYGKPYNDKLEQYYNDNNVGLAAYNLATGKRNVGLYKSGVFSEGSTADGQYTVTRDADESVTLSIPMYTRPKNMALGTDFIGNNPFSAYQRRAVVRFRLLDQNGKVVKFKDLADNEKEVDYRDVPVFQVRRVENPKAIYRAYNNTDPFEVTLMHLENDSQTLPPSEFKPFTSDGPWRASILACTEDFVKLTAGGQTVTRKGQYITGSTGSYIKFTYQPTGTCGATSSRCAIILVEYHDYTCNHLIFVRQGYDDPNFTLAGTKWSCYQVYATGKDNNNNYTPETLSECNVVVTKSPLSVGSLLKRLQYNYSITEYGNPGWLEAVDSVRYAYVKGSAGNYSVGYGLRQWGGDPVRDKGNANGIGGYGWYAYGSDASQERYSEKYRWADTWTTVVYKPGNKMTVPTWQQFEKLRDQADFGFGIAYADGATTTATALTDACGYIDEYNSGTRNGKGVKVCVAYDSKDGKNVLFPLGHIGQARRARNIVGNLVSDPNLSKSNHGGPGSISYGGMSSVLKTYDNNIKNIYRPITYNHYRSEGAIYWVKHPRIGGGKFGAGKPFYASWDINYFTLRFTNYDEGSLGKLNDSGNFDATSANNGNISDALPIKLVYQ